MLLSATPVQTLLSNPNSRLSNPFPCPTPNPNPKSHSNSSPRPLVLASDTSDHPQSLRNLNPRTLRHVSGSGLDDAESGSTDMASSASAVASAIRGASTSPVEFTQRIEKCGKNTGLVLPSGDFQRLCLQQLNLFRRIVHPNAVISVYVRPAGSYVMDQLELRRVTLSSGVNGGEVVILVGNFRFPTGLRAAEAAISTREAEVVPEYRAVVFPMVKQPFLVGFLVVELPMMEFNDSQKEGHDVMNCPSLKDAHVVSPFSDIKSWEIQTLKWDLLKLHNFTAEQRSNALNISHTLAMAYVMDQKALLLQQSSWQTNVRMNSLVEQIRGPLSSIRTLSKMLSRHVKKSEVSYDIVEDILVQGDHMRDTLQQLQDAVYLTKANIVRHNEDSLKKFPKSFHTYPESISSPFSNGFPLETCGDENEMQKPGHSHALASTVKDLEMPMPPLSLAPVQQGSDRPSNVSVLLTDLVEAVAPLAHKQHRVVELREISPMLQVAVEEPALRQALSNLIEGALLRTHIGGRVEIACASAPAGGALVVVDDDGPDMHYMTQMHALTPFGADLFSEDMVEDNMTWNFIAGLTVAREILESYGCVIRVISPRTPDAALGAGGTHVELWLPSPAASSDAGAAASQEI